MIATSQTEKFPEYADKIGTEIQETNETSSHKLYLHL